MVLTQEQQKILSQSIPIKELLKDQTLQEIIKTIDQSENRLEQLEKALNHQEFHHFVLTMISSISSTEQNKESRV